MLPDIYRHAVELRSIIRGDQEIFPSLQDPALHLVALGGIDGHRGALSFQLEPSAVHQILRMQRRLLAEALITLLAELLDPLVRDTGVPKELSDLPGRYLQRLRYLGLLVALSRSWIAWTTSTLQSSSSASWRAPQKASRCSTEVMGNSAWNTASTNSGWLTSGFRR